MNASKQILLGAASFGLALYAAAAADTNSVTLRTTGYFVGLTQGTNAVTDKPVYRNVSFAGHNLVNIAMGRSPDDTNFMHQVLATTFACDLSSASLVVYDVAASNVVATIATSTSIDSVYEQLPAVAVQARPDRAYFVTIMQVSASGNGTNGLFGGYLTVAGRVNLDPKTGCPQPVPVALDRDSLDKIVDDIELPPSLDRDSVPLALRAGLAHLIGVVDAVTSGNAHTILVPYGGLSIRRILDKGGVTAVAN